MKVIGSNMISKKLASKTRVVSRVRNYIPRVFGDPKDFSQEIVIRARSHKVTCMMHYINSAISLELKSVDDHPVNPSDLRFGDRLTQAYHKYIDVPLYCDGQALYFPIQRNMPFGQWCINDAIVQTPNLNY